MGKGGGGGGGGQTSQPHPFVMQAVQDFMGRAQGLSQRPYNPYPGQRVADLTPTHQAALEAGREDMTSTLPNAQNILSRFTSGGMNQPAYIHPFLSGDVGSGGPNNFYTPMPWGGGKSGAGEGLDPSAAMAIASGAAAAPPPAAISGIPSAAAPQLFQPAPQMSQVPPASQGVLTSRRGGSGDSMWMRGHLDRYAPSAAGPANDLVSQGLWDNHLNAYSGGPFPGTSPYNLDDRPSRGEFQELLSRIEGPGHSN